MQLDLIRRASLPPRPPDAFLFSLAKHTATALDLHPTCVLSLLLTNDDEIAALNTQFRHQSKPTDVLSFPQWEGEGLRTNVLGDIVISIERCRIQARARKVDLEVEFAWLFVHGMLHLLGHDHRTPEEAAAMQTLAEGVWEKLTGALSLLEGSHPGTSVLHEDHD